MATSVAVTFREFCSLSIKIKAISDGSQGECSHHRWDHWPTLIKIRKSKSVQAFRPEPYVFTLLSCAMWSFYGLPFVHPDGTLVITINSLGLVMELAYVTVFLIFST
ncbi:hypothetical protein SAY86_015737 [Trapa natans]|uniref:Uncharacterized protein n=1 Tax=Trapa natans TaxID=22666 RepID=A0AAN7LB15_TRANT|nr:hypothetical protein SAY86_015737 [Trapa natans]